MKPSTVIFMQTQGSPAPLVRSLGKLGFRAEGFTDPKAFLYQIKEGGAVLCLLDLSFADAPVMLAMIKSIRHVLGAKLPLIALVPRNEPQINAKALQAGATEVLNKPVDEDELVALVARHVPASGAERPEVPELIKWFFEKLSPALAGLLSSLEESGESERQVLFYEERLRAHRDSFIALVSSLRKTEAKADLTQSIRMYGVRNTRNLVVALRLASVTGMPLVGWNPKTGGLAGEPAHALKFATQTATHFGEGSRNQNEAFNAGLVLDLLSALAETAGSRKAAIRKFIEERYEQAIHQADRAIAAGKQTDELVLERHIITTLLMCEAGRIAMAIFYPEYLELRRRFEKKSLGPIVQHIAEVRQFAVSHNLMGAMICQSAPGLGDAYRCVLFYDYAYVLEGVSGESNVFDLIQVCNR